MCACRGLLARADHVARGLEQRLAREHREVFAEPFSAHHSGTIDEKKVPLRDAILQVRVVGFTRSVPVEHAIATSHGESLVTQQGVGQFERVGKSLLGKLVVSADAEDLDAKILELGELGLPGREVLTSDRREIGAIELDQHRLLTSELSETDRASGRRGQVEIRRLLANLDGLYPVWKGSAEHCGDDECRSTKNDTSRQRDGHPRPPLRADRMRSDDSTEAQTSIARDFLGSNSRGVVQTLTVLTGRSDRRGQSYREGS